MPELFVAERQLVLPPRPFMTHLSRRLIGRVHDELAERAYGDPEKCYGMFIGNAYANNDGLKYCEKFASRYGVLGPRGSRHRLSHILLALEGLDSFGEKVHLDVAKEADPELTKAGIRDTSIHVSRMVVSLGLQDTSMTVSSQDPATLQHVRSGNHLKPVNPDESLFEELILRGRRGGWAHGVQFDGGGQYHGGANNAGRIAAVYTLETPRLAA